MKMTTRASHRPDLLKSAVIEERIIKHGDRAKADRFFNAPHAAWKEAVVNAVYHRRYEVREPIEVRVLPDEITGSSYPGLDRSVSIKDLRFPGGWRGNYAKPGSVVRIGDYAFYGCALTNVTVPASVASVGSGAFQSCANLTGVIVPAGVTSFGNYAFGGCASLGNVTIGSGVTHIGWGAFYWCPDLGSVCCKGNAPAAASSTFVAGQWKDLAVTTNLSNPVWTALATNPLVSGTNHFSDPGWTNYPGRFYHISTSNPATINSNNSKP